MTCRRFGGVTIGETTEAESIAAVAGTPPAATCNTRFGPALTAPRRLDAVKIENADELAFIYGEE